MEELADDLVEAGDLGSLGGELVLEAPARVPELVGREGVSSFLGDFGTVLAGDVDEGKMLLRLAGMELASFAGVLGRTGIVLVRLLGVTVDAFPSVLAGLGVEEELGALAGVLGLTLVELGVLAVVGLVVLLGVEDREGRELRRGALRRSMAACCCCLRLLSITLYRGACDPMRRNRRMRKSK
jgi:hypothetical protein